MPLVCYPDPLIPEKKDPRPVDALLHYVLSKTRANVELIEVVHTASSREPGLQAADVAGGAIFYRINKRQNFGTILNPILRRMVVDQWSVFPKEAVDAFRNLL